MSCFSAPILLSKQYNKTKVLRLAQTISTIGVIKSRRYYSTLHQISIVSHILFTLLLSTNSLNVFVCVQYALNYIMES